jgi:K+-transporting ATPase ATPase C chain
MLNQLRPAIVMIVLATVLLGLVFPLAFTGAAGLALPGRAGGSLIARDGKPIGSALIGQNFTDAKYFHPRPSALTGTDPKDPAKTVPTPYDAGESGASNLGPTSKTLVERVQGDVRASGLAHVPTDLATASASGLDPDISPDNALAQADRVAHARKMTPAQIRALIAANTTGRLLGVFGEPRVNVLRLNLALDAAGHG